MRALRSHRGLARIYEQPCQNTSMLIRPAADGDANAIWAIMEPIIRAGETYCLPRDMDKESALAYWLSAEREVFVADRNGGIVGSNWLQEKQEVCVVTVVNCRLTHVIHLA